MDQNIQFHLLKELQRKEVSGTTGCMPVNHAPDEHLPKQILSPIAPGLLLKLPARMDIYYETHIENGNRFNIMNILNLISPNAIKQYY